MPANITYKGELLTSVNNNQAKVLKTKGTYLEDDVTITEIAETLSLQGKTITINNAGTTTVTPDSGYDGLSEVEVNVPEAEPYLYYESQYITQNNNRKWQLRGKMDIDDEGQDHSGFVGLGTYNGSWYPYDAVASGISITPTESTQTIGGTNYMMEGPVTINPIPAGALYGQVAIPSDLTGGTSTVQWTVNSTTGLVEVSQSGDGTLAPVYNSGYLSTSDSMYVWHGFLDTYQLPTLPSQTITPTESTQTISSTGKYMTGDVTVNPITSTYVGSGITARNSLTVSGPTVTASAGYYASDVTTTIAHGVTQNIEISAFTPGITINNSGLISTTGGGTKAKQAIPVTSEGYIDFTDRIRTSIKITDATYQLPTLPAQSFTPSSTTQTVASTGKYMLGDITVQPIPSEYVVPTGVTTITSNGTHNVTNFASASVNVQPNLEAKSFTPSETSTTITADAGNDGLSSVTVAGITNTYVGSGVTRLSATDIEKEYRSDTDVIRINIPQGYHGQIASSFPPNLILPTQSATTIIPSESSQTAVDIHKWTTGTVTVAGITSTYVGSGITTNPTITMSGPSVTIPAGYYSSQQTKTVPTGYLRGMLAMPVDIDFSQGTTPTASWTVDTTTGMVYYHVYGNGPITTAVEFSGYIEAGTPLYTSYEAGDSYQLPIQGATTVTPSRSTQTINVTGKYMTGNVTVNPIPSSYIIPTGTITITTNGTHNVSSYASANVNVQPNLTTTVVTATSTTQTITPPNGYVGFSTVTVNAITLVTYYTGITTPASNFGNNGDIYLVTD